MKDVIMIDVPEGQELDEEKTNIVFKDIGPDWATKWEDMPQITGYYTTSDAGVESCHMANPDDNSKDVFPTEQLAHRSIAEAQLLQYMAQINDGWAPDWEDDTDKHVIVRIGNKVITSRRSHIWQMLVFETPCKRDWFFVTHKELIAEYFML